MFAQIKSVLHNLYEIIDLCKFKKYIKNTKVYFLLLVLSSVTLTGIVHQNLQFYITSFIKSQKHHFKNMTTKMQDR